PHTALAPPPTRRSSELKASAARPAITAISGTAVPSKKALTSPLPIAPQANCSVPIKAEAVPARVPCGSMASTEPGAAMKAKVQRSEEHTSELQSREKLV